MTQMDAVLIKGKASKASPLVKDLHLADSKPLPLALQPASAGNYQPRVNSISMKRYYDPAFAELEREKLWLKTWQYACREEDIPNVGDRVPYDVGNLSFVIVRSSETEIRAFFNTCLHRGTKLCSAASSGETIRCPFHAWEWKIDGQLHNIPSDWDFPHVKQCHEKFDLPQAKVATWGGFIFINPDQDAPEFAPLLGILPEHFKSWEPENHYTHVHVSKRVHANWKVTMEAFLEAYHVIETHSDALPFTGDATTQYDIWDDGVSHISRLITPLGVPSPHLGDEASRVQALQGTAMVMAVGSGPGVEPPNIQSSESGRAEIAQWRREMMGAALGRDFSALSDAEMVDTIQYFMFPNFCPWYGEGLPLVYQFLPDADSPDYSYMNVRLLAPVPGGGVPCPPSAPIVHLGEDDDFTTHVPILGLLAHVFDQDMSNLPIVQKGLKSSSGQHPNVTVGLYQEARIAHFHEVLSKVLELPEGM